MATRDGKELEHVSLLAALEATSFGKNKRPGLERGMGNSKDTRENRGLVLGAIKAFGIGIRPAKATRANEGLARNICTAIKQARPDFPFTSIQVNKNSASALHVDSSNMGPSVIHGLGNYDGGDLYVHGRGRLNVCGKWVTFDGNIPHLTCPFTGRRYTIILFVHQSYKLLPKADATYLRQLGFNFPKGKMMKGAYGTKRQRLDAARCEVPQELRHCIGKRRK